jgi:hypothetical protein
MRDTVCVDFDGVIAKNEGWKGVETFGDPIPGAKEFLENLAKVYDVIIFTCRCTEGINGIEKGNLLANRVREYLDEHGMTYHKIWNEQGKPIAKAYVDDRGISCRPEDDPMAYEKVLLMLENI